MTRTKSVSTKVTDEEYARLATQAGTETLSEWVRSVLLRATQAHPIDRAVLAEVAALRTIVLTLHYTIANGHRLTVEQMDTLIDRADAEKWVKAQESLAAAIAGGGA